MVVLHELAFAARIADRIAVLSKGKIVIEGSPQATLTSQTLADVWPIQAEITTNARGVLQIDVLGPARDRLKKDIG